MSVDFRLQAIQRTIPALYNYIRERYGIHVVQVEEFLRAGLPDSETQKLLGLKRKSSIIVIERKVFSIADRIIELRRSVARADHY